MTPPLFKRTYVLDAPSLPLRMGHLRGIPIESLFTLFYSSWARAMSVLFLLRLRFPVELLFANR